MLRRVVVGFVFAGMFGCGQVQSVVDSGVVVDAGTSAADAGSSNDAGSKVDAGASADAGPTSCTGACAVTDLVATFHGVMGQFDRAQHGVEGDAGLYIEAHFGGDPACPTASSPTPDRTLVISGLRADFDGGVQTRDDGLRVTLLDFKGNLSSSPFDKAFAARATTRWMNRGTLVSFTLEADFDGGTVRGGFSAPHCASLDGP
jgi:hypothetical protein